MNAVDMITGRRSIRKYQDKIVPQETLQNIVEVSKYAPSWANFQIARYNFISDPAIITKIAAEGVNGFVYNKATLENAKNILVLSFVQGKSGKLDPDSNEYSTSKSNEWEMFDAGIACQTFCLAAHEQGVGTCIFGVIDPTAIAKIINLPDDETVGTVITLGYPDEIVAPNPRKEVSELTRFL